MVTEAERMSALPKTRTGGVARKAWSSFCKPMVRPSRLALSLAF
jgi:hypothetical protein